MMTRRCDHCGKKIEGDFYRMEIKHGSGRIEMRHIKLFDLCDDCMRKIMTEVNADARQH